MAFTGTFTRVINEDLAASSQSSAIMARKFDIFLTGTWVGTVQVQIKDWTDDTWFDLPGADGTFTSNDAKVIEFADERPARVDFARTSGTVTVILEAAGRTQ